LDGLVVFKGELLADESRQFGEVIDEQSRRVGMVVDFLPKGEAELLREGDLPTKAASRTLVYGEDIRRAVPAASLWRYLAEVMRGSWFYLLLVRGNAETLGLPLDYPDPNSEFYGYERNGLRSLDGWDQTGTKALVGGITLAATTLVGIRAGVVIVRSADSVTAYRDHIGDNWTAWLAQLYLCCKQRWNYRIPQAAADRQELRELCRQTLDFENHYLQECWQYLHEQLSVTDSSRAAVAADCLRVIDLHFACLTIPLRT
jgi:hypothetical protein